MRYRSAAYWLIINFATMPVFSAPQMIQTQSQLHALNQQITHLEQALNTAHDKRGTLTQELAGTEKLIGDNVQHLRQIQKDMHSTEYKIQNLGEKIDTLNQELKKQQSQLAQLVVHRYKMHDYQPIKWIVDHEEPGEISRVFTYYRYLVKRRQDLIDDIANTKKSITVNKSTLHQKLSQKKQLENALAKKQFELNNNKQYQTHLVRKIDTQILTHQQHLSQAKQNRENLSKLLSRLTAESMRKPTPQPKVSLGPVLSGRFARPVSTQSLRNESNGLTFIAPEGTPVYAVNHGKVVFSDWLNGYGLLMIVDHGGGFMTLYAHNQSLFKRKGQTVDKGERIASVGHTGGTKENGLYFEVRQRGTVVSARKFIA